MGEGRPEPLVGARHALRADRAAPRGSTPSRRKTSVSIARPLLIALLLLGAAGAAHGAACVAIASGNWNAAGTWQSGTIPSTTSDTASIGAFTVTLTANQSCGSITFTGAGTITGAFTLTTLGTITASGADVISTSQVDIGNATETLSSGASAANTLSISAAIVNSSGTGNLAITGSGKVVLSGANTYNGTTSVAAGATLSAASASALGTTGTGTTVSSGGVLDINGAAVGAEPVSVSGTGIGSGGAITGTGTASFSGAVTMTANTSLGGTGALTLSGAIGGAFAVTKVASGTITLSGTSTYSGATTVSAGTLSIASAGGLGSTTGVSVTSGATLDINGAAVGSIAVTINGTGVSSVGALTGTGTGSLAGAVTLGSASSIGGTGTLTLSGAVGGAFALTKVGSGTISLSGASTYSGATTVSAGTLSVANASGLGSTTGVSVTSGATLDINGVAVGAIAVTINGTGASSVGALTGTGTGSLAGTVTLGSASTIGGTGTLTLSTAVAGGTNTLGKVGAGTLIFGGNNTYTGATTLSAGTLLVNGTCTASAISLAGGTLGGNGTVGTISSSSTTALSTIMPGTASAKGTLTAGATDLSGNGTPTVYVRVTGTTTSGTDFDRLALGGSALTLNGGSTLIVDVGGLTAAGGCDVITCGSISGTFTTVQVINGAATVSYTATTVHVAATVDTLIAEYKCDSSSGTTLYDTSGNGFNGTFSSSDFSWDPTGGVDAGALVSNGTGYVTLPTSPALQPTCVGVSLWAKRTAPTWRGKANVFLWSKPVNWYDASGYYCEMWDGDSSAQSLAIWVDGDGVGTGRGVRYQGQTPDDDFPLNQWVHVFYTFNSVTHTGAVYRDGVALGTTNFNSPSTITKNSAARLIGLCYGEIDLFRIYANPSATLIATLSREKCKVWNGGSATGNNWSDGTNWVGGVAPSAGDSLVFTGSTRLTPNNDYVAGTAFRSIAFTAGGFTLGGNSVTLTTGIANDYNVGTNTVNLAVTLAQAQSFAASAGGTLVVGGAVANGGFTLTLEGDGTVTVTGVVSGAGGLASGLAGGVYELTALNTYTGTTTCNSGFLRASNTVQASANGAFGNAASAIVLAGGSVQANTATFSRALSATGGGIDAYGSARTVSSTIATTSPVQVGGTTAASAAGQALTLSGVVSGAGGLTKIGTSTVIVGANGTWTGPTTVSGGTLQCNAASRLPLVATAVASGGTLDCNGFNQAIGTLTGAGTVTLGSATLTLGGDNGSGTFSGVMSGTGGFTKNGTGTWTDGGTNTFSGAATISAGTVTVANSAALGTTAGATTVSSGATLRFDSSYDIGAEPLTLSGTGVGGVGALYSSSTGAAICSGAITLGSSTRIGVDGWSMYLKGAIGGANALEKTGSGMLILSAANGYTGATTVSGGTIQLDGDTGTIASSSGVAVVNGATLGIGGTGDSVWWEDAVPTGATLTTDGGDVWTWVTSSPAPYAGTQAHQSANVAGEHQHYFSSATQTMPVAVGDTLFVYVYLDAANPPSEIMLQWNDGTGSSTQWEHRAYWGTDTINWGAGNPPAHYPMGALPATGVWTRLSVPASSVNLEGFSVSGMAFALQDGRVTWDHGGHARAASGTGAANPDRIGNTAAVTLTGGSVTIASPANVARSETTGQLVLSNGASTITAFTSGTGTATLTAASLSRSAGASLSFSRGSASPFGNLFFTAGTADGTVLPWSAVTQSSVATGQYTTANGLVQLTSGATTYTSTTTGNWTTNTTWSPSTGHPTASDDMVIANGHRIHSDTSGLAVHDVAFNDVGQIDMNQISVGGAFRFLGSSWNQTWIGVDLAYGANEAVFDHENAAGSVYFYRYQTLTGTGGVTKTGPGTFDFRAYGSYSGPTNIVQGTFLASDASALGDTATGTTVQPAGLLKIAAVAIAGEPLTISGTGAAGTGTLRGYGASSFGGPIALAADSAVGADGQATFTVTGAIGGAFNLTLNDTGTLVLNDASTYTGTTTMTGAGTVRLSADAIAGANGPLGNASSAISLDGSAIEVNTSTMNRSIAVTTSGGRIDAYGAARTVASSVSGSTASGLMATFFAANLGSVTEDDWRVTRAAAAKRLDSTVHWVNAFGTTAQRQTYNIQSDGSGEWQAFSVQWDGWITVHDTCDIMTDSDDDSRVWIDLNGNGAVDPGEWGINGWGSGGQSATLRTVMSSVPPGTYRIRVQYQQGSGGDEMSLLWTDSAYSAGTYAGEYIVPSSCLSTQAWISLGGLTTPSPPAGAPGTGLVGSYFAQDLRGVTADDWRGMFACGGTRLDAPVSFAGASWGDGTAFGISGGVGSWTNFSTQWDGYLTVANTCNLMTASDDESRLAIDLDGDGVFSSSEWAGNSWDNFTVQGTTLVTLFSSVAPGTYRIRAQYEQGNGSYEMQLLWSDSANSAGTWTGTGGTGYVIPSSFLSTGSVSSATTTAQPLAMTGVLSGSLDLRKVGASTATLTTAQTYTGCTGVEGGTLVLGVANCIPSTSATGVASGATLILNGFAQTVASLAGSGSLMLGNARLTCGDASSTTFSGPISGAGGGITKQGSGTLTLSGTNTYSGASIVNAGALEIDGSTASSAVTVNAGSLSGVGTVGAITADGGSVAPGNGSIGTLTGASATIGAGAKLHARIAGYTAGSTFDRLALGSGALSIEGATLELDLSSLASTGTATGLVTCGSVIGKFASVSLLNNSGSYSASVVYNATSIDVVITAAPLLWWKLDERAGTFITDSSGNGHNGTLISGTWVPSGGAIDGALSLPSTTGSYAEGDTSSALSPPQLTFMCWVKRTAASWSGRENVLFWAKTSEDAASWTGAGWYVATKDKGTPGNQPPIYIDIDNSSGYSIADQSSDAFYPQNTWVHIAVTIDTTLHTCVMYKNGSPTGAAGTWGSGPWTLSSNSGRRALGRISSGGTNWWTAADNEDDVRIYGTVLSANDIAGIYAAGRTSRVWTGAGGNANWSTAANWTDSVVPNAGDNLVFPSGALQTTNTDDIASGTYNSISFTGGGYSLGSNGVTLSNGVVGSAGSNTIALPLTLSANQTFTAASGATLTFSNLGTIANGGFRLYIDGAGTGAYGGVISGGGGVTKTGTGTTTISAVDTYTGSTVVAEGELDVTGTLSASSAVSVTGGALGGTGTVGAITGTGGTIRPGTSGARGILHGGSTNLSGGGSVTIRIAALSTPGTDYDRLDLATASGTLTLNGTSTLILDLSGLATTGRAANVITCSGTASGLFSSVQLINNPNGWIADVDYSTSGGVSVTLRSRRLTPVGVGVPYRF